MRKKFTASLYQKGVVNMYYKVKFVETDGAIQNMCMYHKKEIQKWINNNDVSIMKVTKITKKSETDITNAFSIKNKK